MPRPLGGVVYSLIIVQLSPMKQYWHCLHRFYGISIFRSWFKGCRFNSFHGSAIYISMTR